MKKSLQIVGFVLAAAAWLAAGRPQEAAAAASQEVAKLVAVLEQQDAPLFDKAKACQRLAVVGDKTAVPALAALLDDEQLAHYARFGLEPIDDPSVDQALSEAAGRLQGNLLVGVINSMGQRHQPSAVKVLAGLLESDDAATSSAAAAALSRVATPEAAQLISQSLAKAPASLAPAMADAALACGRRLVEKDNAQEAVSLYEAVRKADLPKYYSEGAVCGLILAGGPEGGKVLAQQLQSDDADMFDAALFAVRQMDAQAAAKALAAQLGDLPAPRKALVILALADLKAAEGRSAALEAAKSDQPELRVAGIRALARLGDASAVPVLMEALSDSSGDVVAAAKASLLAIDDPAVDQAIAAALGSADGAARAGLALLAGQRRVASTVPELLKAADDQDPAVRLAAVQALGETASPRELDFLMKRASTASGDEAPVAKEALMLALQRMPDREIAAARLAELVPQSSAETRTLLFEMLATVGGQKALETVGAAAKSGDDQAQDLATRVLGEWMSADAAPVLLDLAQNLRNEKYQLRALRGYIRIARQLDMPAEERIAMCRQAMAISGRDEEKKLVLEVLMRNPSPETLELAVAWAADPSIPGGAGAALGIGEKLLATNRAAVAAGMQRLLQTNPRGGIAERAQTLLKNASN